MIWPLTRGIAMGISQLKKRLESLSTGVLSTVMLSVSRFMTVNKVPASSVIFCVSLIFSNSAHANFFSELLKGQRFNPNEIGIENIEYGGDGCRHGTVSIVLSQDASELSVLFDEFQTRVGADVSTSRSNCEVRIKIRKPRLWSYRIDSVDFRGFVHLDAGVRAEQKVDFQNGPSHAGLNKSFGFQRWTGPLSQNYLLSTIKPLSGPDLLACLPAKKSVDLKLRSTIEIKGGGGHKGGMMAVDSADGRVIHRYRLSWISCLKEFRL